MSLVEQAHHPGPAGPHRVAEPAYGGTLRLLTTERIEALDPATANGTATRQLLWATSRQLFAYPATTDPPYADRRARPVPDLAAELPTRAGGTVTADGRQWTVRLRADVHWDTDPPRPVTAADVVRALKRLAGPAARSAALAPLADVLLGLADYHAAARRAFARTRPTAAGYAEFAARHDLPGARAVDAHTLHLRLRRPVDDLVRLLAGTGLAPVPAEYDAWLPGAAVPRSTGPFRPVGRTDGGVVRLVHNPAWDPQTDPLRARFVDRIEARGDATADEVRAAGRGPEPVDLSWAGGAAAALPVPPVGWALDAYLVFNLRGPARPAGPRHRAVRRAVALAVDRLAVAEALAVPGVPSRLQHGLLPPGTPGHRPYDPWPTPYHRGDPEAARAALAELGPDARPALHLLVPDEPRRREAAEILAANLAAVGIAARLTAHRDGDLHDLLLDPTHGRAGRWDVALCGWTPDRCADPDRELRSLIADDVAGGRNYGGYRSTRVARLLAAVRAEPDPARAAELRHRVDVAVLRDLPVVPLVAAAVVPLSGRSPRVRNLRLLPHLHRVDLTRVWLDPDTTG
ncbi:ABC transporter substrate-binding protein [Micromonospora auratinigra]|uniref:Peptide/nickel transport system substrate-binding protein n=1 Tax=Micromonospora auratinigra TaxID=261654 RepID=A0A1A8ZGU2_9ACTN|nr:ABC transporter substrate-binding protein [Micromonospora auratinigra]SBT43086.1 peptide/nickel transport system substrate-binding protein [Micromonospora auratinigra]